MIFAGIPRNVGVTVTAILIIAWVIYIAVNLRRARPEVGSEIELAANRKAYYPDEVLEGPRLERVQLIVVSLLAITAVWLPLVWVLEPGRQAGAVNGYNSRFAGWGSKDFDVTANGGFNCAGCHGGMKATGGVAAYTVTDPTTGQAKAVNWKAPALNTVLYRFDESEVKFILTYGRPFSPMSPWGIDGGGPMNDQQLTDLIAYIKSIQIKPAAGQAATDIPTAVSKAVADALAAAKADPANAGKSDGELLFSLGDSSGAYSCARCHTKGWSYDDPQLTAGGALGPNLTNGDTVRQFPNEADMITFISQGSVLGKKYGQQGQGSGRMPGFGQLLTSDQIKAIADYLRNR